MKKATLTETKNRLSALIDEVREGESVLILDRGRPVARIESVLEGPGASEGRLERLERKGALIRARDGVGKKVLKKRPPRSASGASVVDALLADRRGSR